jgi:hypothetical protein
MPYCPKCGAEVSEDMAFCPRCGASLKGEKTAVKGAPLSEYRQEKAEKDEKTEKHEKEEMEKREWEKGEKYEKREFGFVGPLVGGLFLIFLGFMFYLRVMGYRVWEIGWALFFVTLGILIIIGAIIAAKRQPRPRGTI